MKHGVIEVGVGRNLPEVHPASRLLSAEELLYTLAEIQSVVRLELFFYTFLVRAEKHKVQLCLWVIGLNGADHGSKNGKS